MKSTPGKSAKLNVDSEPMKNQPKSGWFLNTRKIIQNQSGVYMLSRSTNTLGERMGIPSNSIETLWTMPLTYRLDPRSPSPKIPERQHMSFDIRLNFR